MKKRALQLKSNSSVLLFAFDDDEFLNIWVANSDDGVKIFKHNEFLAGIDILKLFF